MRVHIVTEPFTLDGRDYKPGDEIDDDLGRSLADTDNQHRTVKVERADPKRRETK